jgi:peptidyl-prolyl cis-trans isomerase C
MKKLLIASLLIATALPLSAKEEAKPKTISVNGVTISQPMFQFLAQERLKPGQKVTDEDHQKLLNEVINIVLLSQDALKKKLEQDKVHAASLEMQRLSYLANAALQEQLKQTKIDDTQAKALYKERFATPKQEYKARHILLKDEKAANDVIAELKKGGDFAELAKKHSTGPSGPKGGDLGWFTPARMVKPFSDAVVDMKKGSYTEKPVQTQFGWHVILLEDSRDVPARSYDEIKDSLKATLQHEALQNYITSLRKTADIKAGE